MAKSPLVLAGTRLLAGILVTVAIIAVAYKTIVAIGVGPGWDTYGFLANAAEFAGKGYGYSELHRPPFTSWVTSLLFRAGAPMHEAVIQMLDAALSLLGLVAFYLLMRRRFSRVVSAASMLLLLGVPPLWLYLGTGYTDMPSVGIGILMLWAVVKATEDDPLFYLLAGPLYTVAVLTRYTSLLMAFPALVWLLMRWQPFRHARYIGGGALLAAMTYLPAGSFYALRFGDAMFPFAFAFSITEAVSTPTEGVIEAAGPWYLVNMPDLFIESSLGFVSIVLILAAALGLLWGVSSRVQALDQRPKRIAAAVLFALPAVAAQLAGAGMVLRQLTIPLAVYGVWRAMAPVERDENDAVRVTASAALDAMMIAWLLSSFDFHGHFTIQVPRYVIAMAPPFVYLLVRGLRMGSVAVLRAVEDAGDTDSTIRRDAARGGFALALAVVALASVLASVRDTSTTPDHLVEAAEETAEWLRANDNDLDDATVQSDLWPLTAWYARIPATAMPSFEDSRAFSHELDKRMTDYYVTIRARRYAAYDEVYDAESAIVLERSSDERADLPEVLYLGAAWDNYLEEVTDYDFYLMHDHGRYGWEGTAFMDAMTAEELAEFDAVAVYDVRWRDRVTGEAALIEYVENGGSLIIDASSNLGALPFELGDTVMFDTVIRRGETPAGSELRVAGETAALEAGPFVDENGGAWYGAMYEALPEAEPLDVLATLGGRPVIAVREVGQGKVYWIGQNLVWNAFLHENADEAALIGNVFDEAIEENSQR